MKRHYERHTPIFALATALAPAALAVFRMSGTGCIALFASCFRSRDFANVPGNTVRYGNVFGLDGGLVDEGNAAAYRAPKSYTGEESVELTVHGGLAVIAKVTELLRELGFKDALAGEFTFRAFMNGKLDLVKAEAVEEIVEAETDAARSGAAGRLSGALSQAIETVKQDLLAVLAATEIRLDYAEDDDIHDDLLDEDALESCAARLRGLSDTWASSRIYREGVKVAIAGRTNAGKSSLFNRLLREDRAIVSDEHGTTRDWLESLLDVKGIPVRLLDTAGLRETENRIERMGIFRTRDLIKASDIVLYVVDASVGLSPEDDEVLAGLGDRKKILVWNKVDLGEASVPPGPAVRFSALSGEGFGDIEDAIEAAAFSGVKAPIHALSMSVASGRQKELIDRGAEAIGEALVAYRTMQPLDIVALDLKAAVDALGEITGEVSTEDMLDVMFSSFCVGK